MVRYQQTANSEDAARVPDYIARTTLVLLFSTGSDLAWDSEARSDSVCLSVLVFHY